MSKSNSFVMIFASIIFILIGVIFLLTTNGTSVDSSERETTTKEVNTIKSIRLLNLISVEYDSSIFSATNSTNDLTLTLLSDKDNYLKVEVLEGEDYTESTTFEVVSTENTKYYFKIVNRNGKFYKIIKNTTSDKYNELLDKCVDKLRFL